MAEQALEEGALETPPLRAVWGRQSRLAFVIALALAAVLLIFSLRGVSWIELLGAVRRADGGGVLLAIALVCLSYFVRGLRWRVLIQAEAPLSVLMAFWLTAVSYLGNNFCRLSE